MITSFANSTVFRSPRLAELLSEAECGAIAALAHAPVRVRFRGRDAAVVEGEDGELAGPLEEAINDGTQPSTCLSKIGLLQYYRKWCQRLMLKTRS